MNHRCAPPGAPRAAQNGLIAPPLDLDFIGVELQARYPPLTPIDPR